MSLRRKAQINNTFVKILEVFLKEFISKNGYLLMLVKDTEQVTYLIYIYNKYPYSDKYIITNNNYTVYSNNRQTPIQSL